MQWKDMTGEERYRVVEMARKGERPIGEICRTFGVSRQALSKAIEKVSQVATEALEPKKPGRKGKTEEEQRIESLAKKSTSLEKQVKHWKMRFEVAQAFIDLAREQEQREKKKESASQRRTAGELREAGQESPLAPVDDGRDALDRKPKPGAVDEEA